MGGDYTFPRRQGSFGAILEAGYHRYPVKGKIRYRDMAIRLDFSSRIMRFFFFNAVMLNE